MTAPNPQVERLNDLIAKWKTFRVDLPETARYCQIKGDLYQVRNAGWDDNPSIGSWPPDLIDPDDTMMAAVEHYFLCRCWVGTGKFPAWQMSAMNFIYDIGKLVGVTPQHNPNKPTSKLTALQMAAKVAGVRDGEDDLAKSGQSAPWIAVPPKYY
ncbi:hypothetical protein PQR75_05710 [Paraburkholderia fungorum]|jgi:hypothetical protein|uniref:hypothetical protein n=1 Tax=Paraburkholderia fungorum TaxID=134537 RepID=UPI0038BA0E7C